MAGLQQQLSELTKAFNKRFDKLEGILKEVKSENKALKKTLTERDSEILRLRERLNEQEQYARSWSVRVLNLKLPDEDATDPLKVMKHVYNNAFLPILEGAHAEGHIPAIPPCMELLETAHILPARQNSIPPIICCFFNRNWRALIFKCKRKHAPRHAPEATSRNKPSTARGQALGRFLYPIYEDLTRPNFFKFRAISAREDVEACWTINGQIKYKLRGDTAIKRVTKIFDPPVPTEDRNFEDEERDEDEDEDETEFSDATG
jgi:hypothetical protein